MTIRHTHAQTALAALAQRNRIKEVWCCCHLVMDGPDNRARRRERQAAERGQRPLPALAVMPEHRGTRHDVMGESERIAFERELNRRPS
jgi:hypothetical protein